ncbi:alpha/beta hydrolase [Geminisphaera colitermitum]|uniref:alpha/beta hydrolase n=1 Tax=Geminisphaera colitermitum TaxID=1148786 RepID=UPI000158C891|nr:alpha/beta hydrolase [Geminisphaera colitermitum]
MKNMPEKFRFPFAIALAVFLTAATNISAQTVAVSTAASVNAKQARPVITRTEKDIPYYPADIAAAKPDSYRDTQCLLDIRYPENVADYATLVWFYGGGLTGGKRSFEKIGNGKIARVDVGYRLSPKAENPAWLEDAAAAVAWTLQNIAARGGDPKKVFIAGGSAGGYIVAMLGTDPRWLAPYKFAPGNLAGVIPVSGQVAKHATVKKALGDTISRYRPIIDEWAPLYWVAEKNLPPFCLIVGDRKREQPNRVEENALFASALRSCGHPFVEFYEMGGLDHGGAQIGGNIIIPQFIERVLKTRNSP